MITRRLILAGTGGIAALAASAPSSTPPAETVGRGLFSQCHAFRLPACVFAPGHVTLSRCAVAFAIAPDAVQAPAPMQRFDLGER